MKKEEDGKREKEKGRKGVVLARATSVSSFLFLFYVAFLCGSVALWLI
jgi:hypothetical protein